MRIFRAWAMGMAAALLALTVQAADDVSPRFDITGFLVEGNTLLKAEEVERRVAPFAGKGKNFADVQRALEALQQAYQELGYSAVQVILPEQELNQGVVRFRVIEGRIASVKVEGNQFHDADNVRRSLPALVEGQPPHSRWLAAALRVASENPSKQTAVLLRDGEKEGDIDATIKLTDDKPQKVFLTLDNSGTSQTGRFRAGVGYQDANLFNRDHVFTVQYLTSPENPSKVTILGAGYRVPLYARGDSLDVVAGYSDVDSGIVQNLFSVSGSGSILGARYNQYLQRIGENYEHKVSYGLDYRAYRNSVTVGGIGLVPNITVHPVSLTYSGGWRTTGNDVNFYLGAIQNAFPGGNAGSDSDFKATRAGATAGYRVYRYGMTLTRLYISDWQVRVVLNGQDSPDALVSGEQFGVGGADNVRGFTERELSNDSGHRGSVEFYTPDFGGSIKLANLKLRALAFVDAADIARNDPLPGELQGQSVSSFGLGLRLTGGSNFSVRADWAQVQDASDSRVTGSNVAHVSMAYVF